MPYSALPASRKMPLSVDGTILGWNVIAWANGLQNIIGSTDMAQLDGESPAKNSVIAGTWDGIADSNHYMYALFPELRDVTHFLFRLNTTPSGLTIYGSPDTTNGADGTWTQLTLSGSGIAPYPGNDWWRVLTNLATVTANGSGLRGLRWSWSMSRGTGNAPMGLHIFGAKHVGETPDDVIFLDTDLATELGHDYDYGDVMAASANQDVTFAVKNVSSSHTANSIVLDFIGSYTGDYSVSIDGGSTFASTKTITSLAPQAVQNVVVRLTPPAAGSYYPRAANLRAVVGSWS